MAITAVILAVIGVGLAVLSFVQRVPFLEFTLPQRQVRRIWLPVGLLLITIGGLFGLSYTIAQPGSPIRILETRNKMTQNAFLSQQNAGIALPNSALTATAIIHNATGTAASVQTGTATAIIAGATATGQAALTVTAQAPSP